MRETEKKEIGEIHKQLKLISEIAGSTLAPLIGAIVAGPAGALAGGVAGTLMKRGLQEFMERWLTPKEVKRVGTSAEYIIEHINNRLDKHEELNGKLFTVDENGNSEAEELFDGVLTKCKSQYQEKKLKHIANIFVASVFDKGISSTIANQVLVIAEQMTYSKFCVLAFYGIKNGGLYDVNKMISDPYNYYKHKKFLPDLEIIKQDIFELINFGLISNDNTAIFSSDDIMPAKFTLTDLGKVYYDLLNLSEINRKETDSIYRELLYRDELGKSERG
jgi:hypothetical protein